jgi:hypothetical protein
MCSKTALAVNQMHQYIAARGDPYRLVAGHAVLTGNRLRGRERSGFASLVGRHCSTTISTHSR